MLRVWIIIFLHTKTLLDKATVDKKVDKKHIMS